MELKKKDLVVGQYYYYDWRISNAIMHYKDALKETGILEGRYFRTNIGVGYTEGPIRLATQEEINWLKACVNANKFIPLEKVNHLSLDTYEIY